MNTKDTRLVLGTLEIKRYTTDKHQLTSAVVGPTTIGQMIDEHLRNVFDAHNSEDTGVTDIKLSFNAEHMDIIRNMYGW